MEFRRLEGQLGRTMQARLALALVLFALFTAYSVDVLIGHGLVELLRVHEQGGWSLQVFLDLVLAILGFNVLAAPDAKRLGIPHWPYFVAMLAFGSIGMLAYFVHRELRVLRAGSPS
jgi:uncharacterized membrane protein HdeD (DUF308 family)